MSVYSQSHFVTVGENEIHYRVSIQEDTVPSKALVVVHGALSNMNSTKHFSEHVAASNPDIQVVQLDMPGHGKSTGSVCSTVEDLSDIVINVIKVLRDISILPEDISLLGHSLGGSVALISVANGLEVNRVITCQSGLSWDRLEFLTNINPNILPDVFKQLMDEELKVMADENLKNDLITNFEDMLESAEACEADVAALSMFYIEDRLPEINLPVLVISSVNDETAYKETVQQLVDGLTNATAVVLENGTHTAIMGEYKTIAKLVVDFIGTW